MPTSARQNVLVFTKIPGEFEASPRADRVVGPYSAYSSASPCRGGQLCLPAECTDFTVVYGEFRTSQRADVGIGPYSQAGKCIRIRRKFSRKRSVFRRAEQSPAPTKRVRFN